MDKVMSTSTDKELKGIAPTEKEEHEKQLALKPLTALPEELILFQRVLTLFRGLCTAHSVKLNFIEQLAPFAVSDLTTVYMISLSPSLALLSLSGLYPVGTVEEHLLPSLFSLLLYSTVPGHVVWLPGCCCTLHACTDMSRLNLRVCVRGSVR